MIVLVELSRQRRKDSFDLSSLDSVFSESRDLELSEQQLLLVEVDSVIERSELTMADDSVEKP